mmetsp:Transcript_9503/g.38785  ORF Transcript_9503/g.38785 Transcript_9503/m.38785 type:complete len:103 (-) Transcript_9503:59-367(-)
MSCKYLQFKESINLRHSILLRDAFVERVRLKVTHDDACAFVSKALNRSIIPTKASAVTAANAACVMTCEHQRGHVTALSSVVAVTRQRRPTNSPSAMYSLRM